MFFIRFKSLTGFIYLGFFDYFGFNRQFEPGASQSLHCLLSRNAIHFEKNSPGLDRHDVSFDISFSASQCHLGWKLRNGFVGENPDPNLLPRFRACVIVFSRLQSVCRSPKPPSGPEGRNGRNSNKARGFRPFSSENGPSAVCDVFVFWVEETYQFYL